MIENERNQILQEQMKIEKEKLEFEKERFEFQKKSGQPWLYGFYITRTFTAN